MSGEKESIPRNEVKSNLRKRQNSSMKSRKISRSFFHAKARSHAPESENEIQTEEWRTRSRSLTGSRIQEFTPKKNANRISAKNRNQNRKRYLWNVSKMHIAVLNITEKKLSLRIFYRSKIRSFFLDPFRRLTTKLGNICRILEKLFYSFLEKYRILTSLHENKTWLRMWLE